MSNPKLPFESSEESNKAPPQNLASSCWKMIRSFRSMDGEENGLLPFPHFRMQLAMRSLESPGKNLHFY